MLISLTEIRNTIESAMSVYLSSEQPRVRDIMQKAILIELRRNHISRLWCENFKVYTKEDGLGFDTANVSVDSHCPSCGESYKEARLLYMYGADSDDESHVMGCKCGFVYKILWGSL